MKQNKIIGIVLGIVIIIGAMAASQSRPRSTGTPSAPAAPTGGSPTTAYTMQDVANHKDGASCWTTINGDVYDLTAWIAKHPGGEGAILSICGGDGSVAFNDQHGSNGSPARILASYKIGVLK